MNIKHKVTCPYCGHFDSLKDDWNTIEDGYEPKHIIKHHRGFCRNCGKEVSYDVKYGSEPQMRVNQRE